VMRGRVYHALGQYGPAEEYLRASIAAVGDAPLRADPGQPNFASVIARVWLAFCAAERGDFRAAHVLGEEGLRIAQTVGQPWSLINGYWGVGYACLLQGKVEQAIIALEPAVQGCETWRIPLLFPHSATLLGRAYLLARRTRDAQALLERAIQQIGVLGNAMHRVGAVLALGEAHQVAGDWGRAHELASQGLALSEAQGARGGEARAWQLLGEITAHTDSPDCENAESHYRHALAIADELGMRPLVAHCHLGLGTLYQQIGRHDDAQDELATAAEQYRAMEMLHWLEKAKAVAAQVGAR
jgi:tetratricopeptide (TPR) repeat protein